MTDVDLTGSHPCPVPGCHGSAEEHHRVNVGLIIENADLRGQQREGWTVPDVTLPDVITGTPLVLERGQTYVLTADASLPLEYIEKIRIQGESLGVRFVVLDGGMQIAREDVR